MCRGEMEGLLPIFGSWSRHSRWCRERKSVVCTIGAHNSARQREHAPTTWALRARHESLAPGRDINLRWRHSWAGAGRFWVAT